MSSYVFIPSECKHVASSNPSVNIFGNVYLASPAFDLFPLTCSFTFCFELSDTSLPGKTRCRRKMLTAYLPSLKLFLPLPSVEKFAKQANLASHRVFVWVFLLCSSWMYFLMGLSKAINLFELCQWFNMANFRESLSKLVETLQTSVNEDWRGAKNNVNAFANWLIRSDSWFLIGWKGFPHVWETVDSRLWLDEEISVWVFHAIDSIRKSQ